MKIFGFVSRSLNSYPLSQVIHFRFKRRVNCRAGPVLLVSAVSLAACGGGGGSGSSGSGGTPTNTAPTASNVSITDDNAGSAVIGDKLTGNYTFVDADGDPEGSSAFQWLRDGTTISGATSLTYTLVAADVPTQIIFEVTPVAATGTITGSAVSSNGVNTRKPLNDTGIVSCGDYAYTELGGFGIHNNDLSCRVQSKRPTQTTDGSDINSDVIPGGQDALYGRDVTHNDDSDGHAGFSYTQLDSNGTPLAARSTDYSNNPWSCVRDNVTGLIWEVKTTSGLQKSTYTYTWYNSTGINDGGDPGIGDTGVGRGSDNCLNSARCDTEKYVVDVNALNICGEVNDDWRLPTRHELFSLFNNSRQDPAIDQTMFPNTVFVNNFGAYWSSTPDAADSGSAWADYFWSGHQGQNPKDNSYYVRLVRGGR